MRESTHCRSSCRPPAAVDPPDRCSNKIQECSHTGAHSRAPPCYTGPCLQTQSVNTDYIITYTFNLHRHMKPEVHIKLCKYYSSFLYCQHETRTNMWLLMDNNNKFFGLFSSKEVINIHSVSDAQAHTLVFTFHAVHRL